MKSLRREIDWYSNIFGGDVDALWTFLFGGLEQASTIDGLSPCADIGLVPLLSVNRIGLSLTSHVMTDFTSGSVPLSSKTVSSHLIGLSATADCCCLTGLVPKSIVSLGEASISVVGFGDSELALSSWLCSCSLSLPRTSSMFIGLISDISTSVPIEAS